MKQREEGETMDECYQIKPLLSVYLDGEASNEQAKLLTHHLSNCDKCASEMTQLYQTSQTLKAWNDARLSDAIVNQLIKKSDMYTRYTRTSKRMSLTRLIDTMRPRFTISICAALSTALLLMAMVILNVFLLESERYRGGSRTASSIMYNPRVDIIGQNSKYSNLSLSKTPDIIPVKFITNLELQRRSDN
jgi:hypothetical protein